MIPIRNLSASESIITQRDSFSIPSDILADGVVGLEFFGRFHRAASRLGIESRPLAGYGEMYQAESGIDLAALSADVANLAAAVDTSSNDIRLLAVLSDSLTDIWNVDGVDTVIASVRDERRRADADIESMPFVISVSEGLAQIVRTALVDKAFKVALLDRETIGGVDARGVDQLVDVCVRHDGIEAVAQAAAWFAPLSDARFRSVRYAAKLEQVEICRAAVDLVRPWIDRIFTPVYSDARDEFDNACKECGSALTDAFGAAADRIAELFPVAPAPVDGFIEPITRDVAPEPEPEPEPEPAPTQPPRHDEAEPFLELAVGSDTWGFSVAPDGRGVSLDVRSSSGESVTVTVELDGNGWPKIVIDTDGSELPPEQAQAPPSIAPPAIAPLQPESESQPGPVPIASSELHGYELPNPAPLDAGPLGVELPGVEPLDVPESTGAELAGAGPI